MGAVRHSGGASSRGCQRLARLRWEKAIRDYVDAEAVGRANMQFIPIKSDDQLDMQSLHRVRDRWVARRMSVIKHDLYRYAVGSNERYCPGIPNRLYLGTLDEKLRR